MSQTWSIALRVDVTETLDMASLMSWLASVAPGWFGVKEGGDSNCHYHFLLRIAARNLKAIRSKFVRDVKGLGGNASYSMKVCSDEEKYRRYMAKGDDEDTMPEWCCDPAAPSVLYTEDWVHEQHVAYWDENQRYVDAAIAREAAKGQGSLVEQVESICIRQGVRSREGIAKVIVDLYKGWKKPLNVFHARGVLNTVALVLNGEDEYIEQEIVQSICRL